MKLTCVHLLGSAPFTIFVVILLIIELPLDESSIAGTRKEELDLVFSVFSTQFFADSKGGDPATMSLKEALVLEFVSCLFVTGVHFGVLKSINNNNQIRQY